MTLADKLQAIRKAKGLSQQEMAAMLEVTQGAITNLEVGRNKDIKMLLLKKMVYRMGVNPFYLLGDDDKEPMFYSGEKQTRQKLKKYEALIGKLNDLRSENG